MNYGTFTIKVKDKGDKKALKKSVLDYKHLTNILTIMVSESCPKNDDETWGDFQSLTNPILMKAVLFGNAGGAATGKNIALINKKFKDNKWLIIAKNLCSESSFNDKNISMIIRRIKGEWNGFFTDIKKFRANPGSFTGCPKPPRAKALNKVSHASIPLEVSKFSLKKRNILGLTLGRAQKKLKFKFKGMIDEVGVANIKNVKVILHNHDISIQFSYIKHFNAENLNYTNAFNKVADNRTKKRVEAGLDIGINNLGTLFVNDKTTPSLVVCGANYKSYNVKFNRFNSKLNESISDEATEFKTIKKGDDEAIKIATKHSSRGNELKSFKTFLIEKRNRFFSSEFHKISANIVKYCLINGVTDFCLSRNLSMTKTTGEIKQRKAQKQTFYQMPFGDLLNKLEEKLKSVGIKVHDIDEAYTSKSSCISANVNKNQLLRKKNIKPTTTDLNGSRVARGLFKDLVIDKIFNADVNGAVNHIRVAFKRLKFNWLSEFLFKLANPIKLKSTSEFDILLNRISE
jgi:putative transposase